MTDSPPTLPGEAASTRPVTHHRVLIVGGGTAGISVAARLRGAGVSDVGLLEPSDVHHYQPLWTLVGGGRAGIDESTRRGSSVVPSGVAWTKAAAAAVDPDRKVVRTSTGAEIGYDYLVMAPRTPGATTSSRSFRRSPPRTG